MSTHDDGWTKPPDRYSAKGRETIDRIRDELGDMAFVGFCRGAALKYRDRLGLKEGATPEQDERKAQFYDQMAAYVMGCGPDPREQYGKSYVPLDPDVRPGRAAARSIRVLDHGFVRLVESWGHGDARIDEAGIVEAARQSTQGAFRGWDKDAKLLRFLYNHKHASPFEFAGMVIEVRAPIFVFREWHRHRTQSYNEMSARYAPLPDMSYVPTVERLMMGSDGNNQQALAIKGSTPLTIEAAEAFREKLIFSYADFDASYRQALDAGVPKELARLGMPVGRYSQMRASANLRNWLAFLTLRLDPAAQWEIRQYADAVFSIVQEHFPRTAALFRPDAE